MALRALVTGATGFVGRRLLDELMDSGWRVRGLVLPSELESHELPSEVEVTQGDVRAPQSLVGTMDDVDAVFHLAALVDSWRPDPKDFFRVNVEGTRNAAAEAVRAGVPRFLFTSSLSGIGVRKGNTLREDSPPGQAFGAYEQSKAAAERVVWEWVRRENLPAIVIVPSIILGPGDVRNTGKFLLAFVRGEFPGIFAENSVLPVVSVKDVARAHVLAYERGSVGSRYIISSQNLAWGDILRMASDISGTPVPSRKIGPRTLRLASRVWEFQSRITRTPPKFPAWLADFMLTGAPMDNSKSIRELGIEYTPVENALRDAIEWFREEGLVSSRTLPRAVAEASPENLQLRDTESPENPPKTLG